MQTDQKLSPPPLSEPTVMPPHLVAANRFADDAVDALSPEQMIEVLIYLKNKFAEHFLREVERAEQDLKRWDAAYKAISGPQLADR